MKTFARWIAIVAAVLLVAGAATARAQEQNLAQGEIVRVDTAAKTVVIRTETRALMQFAYNDETLIKGSEDSIAGLGTRDGMLVSITYERQEDKLLAKEIAIQKVDEEPDRR